MIYNKRGWMAVILAAALAGSGTVWAEAQENAEMYASELTGEPIAFSLKNQRPIAAMVDNESLAYPHYGMAEADVVYELMNSTANGRITRFMALVKDWGAIQQMGSIRSVRSTNIPLAGEWDAVLCHDGGPYYVNEFFAKDYARQHFSGGFSRVNNGKSSEFTEYIMAGDLEAKFAASGYETEYSREVNGDTEHFQFVEEGSSVNLNADGAGKTAQTAILPFVHTTSTLQYNEETGTYDYYAYGQLHVDAEDGEVLSFENVLLLDCSFRNYDGNGYMVYDYLSSGQPGYYLTGGYAKEITWTKESETGITRYYDLEGEELTVNRGKTYISLIPSDTWESVEIQ